MKYLKKAILFIMVCTFVMLLVPADKAYAGCGTREQALEWVYAQEGRSLDYDGAYGAQCVDLINYYYKHLGVSVVYGNAYTFASNRLPNGWTRIQNTSTFVPQPGDIAVWGRSVGGGYGHVAIVLSGNTSSFTSMDQNWGGRYCRKVTHNYNGFWGVIRPNFDESVVEGGSSPIGKLEAVEGGKGRVKVTGWAFDADDYSKALDIHVYIGDKSGPKNAIANVKADKNRSDVARAYPDAGSKHGFDTWIDISEVGTHFFYVYAINIGRGGSNTYLGYTAVVISKKDTTKPKIQNVKVTDVTSKGYVVSCTVTDNVGIDRVQFPTWTEKRGQDDLQKKWETSKSASGTKKSGNIYTYRVNISDHNNETGTYCTHIYAYDTSGNCTSVAVKPNVIVKTENKKPTVYYGDVNKDEVINGSDASIVLQAAIGKKILSSDEKKRADVNGDGKVTSKDANLILKYDIGSIKKFPAES